MHAPASFEDSPLSPTSEVKRRLRNRTIWLTITVAFLLAGCQAMEQVRRTILPNQDQSAPKPPAAPPAKTGTAETIVPAKPWTPQAAPSAKADAGSGAAPAMTETGTPGDAARAQRLPAFGSDGGRIVLTPPPGVSRTVQVGLLLPLSGPHAGLGQSLLNAAQLALFSLAGDAFTLAPVDTKGTAEGAAIAARNAIDDGARLILGPVFSASVASAAPIARARNIQVVSFSNDRAVAGNGVYVMGFAPETQIKRVMVFAKARGVKRVAAIAPEGPYGDRVEQILLNLMPRLGMEIRAVVRHRGHSTESLAPVVKRLASYGARRSVLLARRQELEGQTDEASKRALRRLGNRDTLGDVGFDAVFLPQGGSALRALAPLLPFYDIDPRTVRMLGTVEWDAPIMATEPALFGGWFAAPPPAARRAFEARYKKTFGVEPARVASLAYDATALAAVIARAASTQPDPAMAAVARPGTGLNFRPPGRRQQFSAAALTAANGFDGVDGIFRLLSSGLVERGLAVMEVRPRRFEVVSPAPRTFERLSN